MKPSDFPGFKNLQEFWERELEKSGFKDIEKKDCLKKSGTEGRFQQLDPVQKEAQAHYFEIIHEKIRQTRFSNEREKQVLYLYAEGYKQVEIKEKLGIEGHRVQIYGPIHKWLRAWGLKK